MIDNIDKEFELIALEISEATHFYRDLSDLQYTKLLSSMEKLEKKYMNYDSMPKYILYCLYVLHHNLLGGCYSTDGQINIQYTKFSSYVTRSISKLIR